MKACELHHQLQGNPPAPMLDQSASCTLLRSGEELRAVTLPSDRRHSGSRVST
jgi:hypothetical protein